MPDPRKPDEVIEPEWTNKEERALGAVEEVRALLRENNSYWKKYGPLLEKLEQSGALEEGPRDGRPMSIVDYAGKALVRGKFDGLLGALEDVVAGRRAQRGNPPARRRR